MQAACYGIGVMAQFCSKDFGQACLGEELSFDMASVLASHHLFPRPVGTIASLNSKHHIDNTWSAYTVMQCTLLPALLHTLYACTESHYRLYCQYFLSRFLQNLYHSSLWQCRWRVQERTSLPLMLQKMPFRLLPRFASMLSQYLSRKFSRYGCLGYQSWKTKKKHPMSMTISVI